MVQSSILHLASAIIRRGEVLSVAPVDIGTSEHLRSHLRGDKALLHDEHDNGSCLHVCTLDSHNGHHGCDEVGYVDLH